MRRSLAALAVTAHAVATAAPSVPAKPFKPAKDSHTQVGTKDGCGIWSEPVYDANGKWYQGRLQVCSLEDVRDVTTGPDAPKPGDMIISSDGRTRAVRENLAGQPPGFLFRGRLNTAYKIESSDDWGFYLTSWNYPKQTFGWNDVSRALPFVPTKFYDLGKQGGMRFVGFGGLKVLPSKAAAALPLNSQSVIVGLNGQSFRSEYGFLGSLVDPWPVKTVNSLPVEVIYFQLDDKTLNFRRAFIPMYQRPLVAKEWRDAAADPGARWLASGSSKLRDDAGNYLAYAGALVLVGGALAGLASLTDYANSSLQPSQQDLIDQNRNRQQPNPSPGNFQPAPSISPFYDEPGWGSATAR